MFMQVLIKQVECSGDLDALYNSYIQNYAAFFKGCKGKVNCFYQEDGMQYDADTNRFILLNSSRDAK